MTPDDAARIREEVVSLLGEDARNTDRLTERLRVLAREKGIGPHAALLLALTGLTFEEGEAHAHWDALLTHRHELSLSLGRDVGVRVAMLDYFVNVNRRLVRPALIDLRLEEADRDGGAVDPRTGLASDRGFRSAVQAELRRAKRYGQSACVVLFDLDGFAGAASRATAPVAERMFREAGMLLGNKIRDIDVAGAPGEDELALLLPETERNGALLVAERYRRAVEAHFARREAGGEPAALTVSGGLACYPEDALTAETLIERAAQALYVAKATGKNQVRAYQPERRRYLRFDLDPRRCEVEVLASRPLASAEGKNLSRSGLLFLSPERLEVGEEIELRLSAAAPDGGSRVHRLRGRVVRLEELPEGDGADGAAPDDAERFEIGMAFESTADDAAQAVFDYLEGASPGSRERA